MTTLLFANNASSSLASAVSAGATTMTLDSGQGALFPSPTSGQAFMLTLSDQSTGLLTEIVRVTARSGDVLTVTRAQEGTTALAWAAGDVCANLITAGTASSFLQAGAVGALTAIAANTTISASAQTTLGSFTVPATGTIAITLGVSVQSAAGMSTNTFGSLAAFILQNGTIIAGNSTPFYLPSGSGNTFGCSTSCLYLPVTAGQTISVTGLMTLNGDGTTAWRTVQAPGSTTSSSFSYHYVR